MSKKYPEWWELPKKRWQERSPQRVPVWDREEQQVRWTVENRPTWRDTQRQKVYNAESRAHWLYPIPLRRFQSIEEIREYVEKVIHSTWVVRRFGCLDLPEVTCYEEQCATSNKWKKRLNFPRWYWDQLDVLHEISHWIHLYGCGSSHGRFFARTMLELCGQEIGPEFRRCLKSAYKYYHVKSSPFPDYSEGVLQKKKHLRDLRRVAENWDDIVDSFKE